MGAAYTPFSINNLDSSVLPGLGLMEIQGGQKAVHGEEMFVICLVSITKPGIVVWCLSDRASALLGTIIPSVS